MIKYIRLIKWDLSHTNGRFAYKWYIVKNLPGNFGKGIRYQLLKKYARHVGKDVKIFEGVTIRNVQNLEIGDNVSIGEGNFLQAAGGIKVGDGVLLGPSVKIWTSNHKFDRTDIPIREQGYDIKPVIIEKNVWIGANTFVMPGAKIPEGVIVSANSVIGVKVINPYSILAGNPARKIGERLEANEASVK